VIPTDLGSPRETPGAGACAACCFARASRRTRMRLLTTRTQAHKNQSGPPRGERARFFLGEFSTRQPAPAAKLK